VIDLSSLSIQNTEIIKKTDSQFLKAFESDVMVKEGFIKLDSKLTSSLINIISGDLELVSTELKNLSSSSHFVIFSMLSNVTV